MVAFYNEFLSCGKSANIKDVIRHIEHIRNLIGADHIGLGGDFNGVDRFDFYCYLEHTIVYTVYIILKIAPKC